MSKKLTTPKRPARRTGKLQITWNKENRKFLETGFKHLKPKTVNLVANLALAEYRSRNCR